jgi:hypothetical protein
MSPVRKMKCTGQMYSAKRFRVTPVHGHCQEHLLRHIRRSIFILLIHRAVVNVSYSDDFCGLGALLQHASGLKSKL